jgi:hypothetical protein
MRSVLLIGYFFLVALGAMCILSRSQSELEYAAERDLPRNHRVVASDLRRPNLVWALASGLSPKSDYSGWYLDRRLIAGESVKREYLKDRPTPIAVHGLETYGWLLGESEKRWSQILDVGWAVDLCADKCPLMGAPVLAVECAKLSTEPCIVILQITPAQRKELLAYPGKQKLNITVSSVHLGERK